MGPMRWTWMLMTFEPSKPLPCISAEASANTRLAYFA